MKKNNLGVKAGLILFFLLPVLLKANTGSKPGSEVSIDSKVEFYAPPTPSVITANGPLTFCIGDSVRLSGNKGGVWSTGDTAASIVVKTSGDYFVTNSDSTGTSTSNHLIVKVDSPPTASILVANDSTTFCAGDSVILSGNIKGVWNTGDTSASIKVKTSGDYFVINANTCDTLTSNHIVVKVNSPKASVISANKATTFCAGDSIIISGNVKGRWSTGDTAASIKVKTSGDYFVINTDSCGSITSNHIIVKVDSLPKASVLVALDTTTFCAGDSVVISGNIKGKWNTGDTTASITVKISGDFFVTNSNTCDTLTSNHIVVKVNPLPVASVITPNKSTLLCRGDSIRLSGNAGGIWNTGDTSGSIWVKTAGDFFVNNSNFCDTVTSNHIVVTIDSVSFASVITANGPTTICIGDSVILSGNSAGKWNTGDTTGSITVKASGDYFARKTNSCDSGISNHIIVTVQLPDTALTITAVGATTFCAGDSVRLSGNKGRIWNTGDTSASIVVKTSGDYYLINSNVCDTIGSNHIIVTVNPLPLAIAGVNDTICQGQSLILGSPAIAGHTYKWTTKNGLNAPGAIANPEVHPLLTTTYILTETITATGCKATHSATITVGTHPSCVIKGNNIICNGQSTTLCAPAGAFSYKWSTGDTSRCITVDSTGNYLVVVTNSFGCSSACSRNVISGQPSGDITGNGFIYKGQSSAFCAPLGFASYLWSTGATTRCITVSTAGTYSVSLTNSNGCTSSSSRVLTVAPEVVCTIIGDSLICKGGLSTLCATDVPGNTYYWNNGQTSRCIQINCEGFYSVLVTNNGLSNMCTLVVKNAPDTLPALDSCFISGNLEPIQGDSSVLCAPARYNSYLWSTGATSRCITIGKSGTYTVTIDNGMGCVYTCSAVVSYIASNRSTVANVVKIQLAAPLDNDHLDLKAYPNPFNGKAFIEFRAPENQAHAVIEVISVAGRKVATIFDQEVTKGLRYRATLDGQDLAEGVYFYKVSLGNRVFNKRLVLVR